MEGQGCTVKKLDSVVAPMSLSPVGLQLTLQELDYSLPWEWVYFVPLGGRLCHGMLGEAGTAYRADEGPCGMVERTYSRKSGTTFPFCYL